MEVQVSNQDNCRILTIKGTVNIQSSPKLRDKIQEELKSGAKGLILDLAGVDYMDSSGVGVLVAGLKAAKEKKAFYALAQVASQVKMVIEVTRLIQIFEIYPDNSSAIAALKAKLSA